MKHYTAFLNHKSQETKELSKKASSIFFDLTLQKVMLTALKNDITRKKEIAVKLDNHIKSELKTKSIKDVKILQDNLRTINYDVLLIDIVLSQNTIIVKKNETNLLNIERKILESNGLDYSSNEVVKALKESKIEGISFVLKTSIEDIYKIKL